MVQKSRSEVFVKNMCAFILCGTSFLISTYVDAQKVTSPEPIEVRDPRLKEGRLFTVEVTPKGRQMRVRISGKEMAALDFAKVGVAAKLHLRDRTMTLKPTRETEAFIFEDPTAAGEKPNALDLDVHYGEKSEQFQFDLNQIR